MICYWITTASQRNPPNSSVPRGSTRKNLTLGVLTPPHFHLFAGSLWIATGEGGASRYQITSVYRTRGYVDLLHESIYIWHSCCIGVPSWWWSCHNLSSYCRGQAGELSKNIMENNILAFFTYLMKVLISAIFPESKCNIAFDSLCCPRGGGSYRDFHLALLS